MRQLLLLPFVLAACSEHAVTDTSAMAPSASAARSSSAVVEHSVTGSAIQRVAPGFEFSTTASVRSDASGALSGKVITRIIDLSAYGYPGKAEIQQEATCMRVVGNTAYIGLRVTSSSDPVAFPVGTLGVFWVRDGGPHGADVGHGGPAAFFDPSNLICTSTPPALPANSMTGNFEVR
jgi:hypothetical protein